MKKCLFLVIVLFIAGIISSQIVQAHDMAKVEKLQKEPEQMEARVNRSTSQHQRLLQIQQKMIHAVGNFTAIMIQQPHQQPMQNQSDLDRQAAEIKRIASRTFISVRWRSPFKEEGDNYPIQKIFPINV